jgi:hypothetical protein
MMFFGFAEVLVLALLAGGMNDTDLVAMVQPKVYFESRQIRLSIDSMIDVAIREPKDNKAQIMQLSALRYLTDESVAFKKADNYATNREAIEEIAHGKRAQDKAGFAKEYAQRMLDKLDGKKPAKAKLEPIRGDLFSWFPADATLVGAIDLRGNGQPGDGNDPVKEILKLLPERERGQMYDMIEKVGNVRLERIALAYSDGNGKNDGRFVLRITGKGSQSGMIEMFNVLDGGRGRLQTKEIKDDKDMPITLLEEANNRSPVIMLVGNTDLVIVAAQDSANNAAKRDDLIQDVLQARAKKKPNAAAGKLKDRLAKVPDKAVGFLVGDMPEGIKRELVREFAAVPSNGFVYVERTPQGLQVNAEGGLANAEDAAAFVQKVGALRKQGIDELKKEMQNPQPPDAPPIPFQGMINLMESMQVQNQGDKASVRVLVPNALIQQVPPMLMPRSVEFKKF